MGHEPRQEADGAVHHVFARGNRRQEIYVDDADRRTYLAMLRAVTRRHRWRCLAYCLMSNHVHLLIETPQSNLGLGMKRLHGPYAQSFNRRHRRVGHLFQGRYGAVRVDDDEQVWATAAYIALNPVEAGLCEAACEWPWSSYAAVVGGWEPAWLDAARLFSYFDAAGGDGRRRYVELAYSGGRGGSAPQRAARA
jgi:putative transposase